MIAFGYYGGKNSKLNFILPQLQTDHKMYVELCGGSAAVLLNKPRSEVEVLNDIVGEVMTFWKVLREQPDDIIRQINYTPAGESEYKRILSLPPTDDEVEIARRFFVRVTQTFACIPTDKTHVLVGGLRFNSKRDGLKCVADRMRDVLLENTDAMRLITRVVSAHKGIQRAPILFYADPPYVAEARNSGKKYLHDDFNHAEFLDAVLDAPDYCKFAISGYANSLYDNRLADWHRTEKEVQVTSNNKGVRRTEILWRNYSLTETARLF